MDGEYIEVRKAGSSTLNKLLKHIFNSALALSVESVEGDEIYLGYTRAKIVRGKKCGDRAGLRNRFDRGLRRLSSRFRLSGETACKTVMPEACGERVFCLDDATANCFSNSACKYLHACMIEI